MCPKRHSSVTSVTHKVNFTSSQWHAIFDHLVVALSPPCPTTLLLVTTPSRVQYFSVLDSPSRTSTSQSANCGMLGDNQRSAPNVWYCLGGVVAKIGKSSMPSRPQGLANALPNTSSTGACLAIHVACMDDIVVCCLAPFLGCVWLGVLLIRFAGWPAMGGATPWNVLRQLRIMRVLALYSHALEEPSIVFAVVLLAPEWILAWAVRQALCARALCKKLEVARRQAMGKRLGRDEGQCEECGERRCRCNLDTAAQRVGKGDEGWTTAHAFLVIMGGFQFCNTHGPIHPLSPASVVELVRRGHLVPPTADELSNQSKGDALSKGAAIIQASWFVMQCIARRVEGLPVTSLEAMTLAYTVMAVAVCIAWWDKPFNVSCAIRVPDEEVQPKEEAIKYSSGTLWHTLAWEQISAYVTGGQDAYVELRKRKGVPTFWAGGHDHHHALIANIISLLAGMVFGADRESSEVEKSGEKKSGGHCGEPLQYIAFQAESQIVLRAWGDMLKL
ncbi:hypothetical protein FIBSPDRAFT_931446 [Athelia psychrophila]|uniref:Uncharacterized protein n=1 Tax=Athelia psychrophila TaxID=1759441 RepID=A0A166KFK4_9AGAM|nr:hypothetical protein FIBSPDRAFT_931446 [Fibularhizoctonia sp. CBS 109695]